MDTKELAQWMDTGAKYYDPDTSMQGSGLFDEAFGATTRDDAPEVGTPVMGYRVVYTVETPQGKVYFGPLVKRTGSQGANNYISMIRYANQHAGDSYEVGSTGIMNSNNPTHHDPEEKGFYYFADKDTAEEYMKVIAQGGKKVGDISNETDTPIQLNYGEINSKGLYEGPGGASVSLDKIKLELYRVEGIAAENRMDEGYVMQDMSFAQDPDISISIGDFQKARKEIQQNPSQYELFTRYGAGVYEDQEVQDWRYYHNTQNKLRRLFDDNKRTKTAMPTLRKMAQDLSTPWYADTYRAQTKEWEHKLDEYWNLEREFREWKNSKDSDYLLYLQYSGRN